MKERVTLRIVDMPEASWWEEKRKLPRVLFPFEYALNPCERCPGHCCRANVRLTSFEAARIALTLSVSLDDVVDRMPADDEKARHQAIPIHLDEGLVQLVLKHKPAGECLFLVDVGGRGRCGAYALRPGACRLFPYDVEYGERAFTTGGQAFCPTRWVQNAQVRRRVRKDLERWMAEIDEERALVDEWNRSERDDRSWSAFQRVVVDRFAHRFGKDPADVYPAPRRQLGERPG